MIDNQCELSNESNSYFTDSIDPVCGSSFFSHQEKSKFSIIVFRYTASKVFDILEDKNKMFFKASVYLTAPWDGTMPDEDSDETWTSV